MIVGEDYSSMQSSVCCEHLSSSLAAHPYRVYHREGCSGCQGAEDRGIEPLLANQTSVFETGTVSARSIFLGQASRQRMLETVGRGSGIRTHGAVTPSSVQSWLHRPLGHPSSGGKDRTRTCKTEVAALAKQCIANYATFPTCEYRET
jgi:hypothetical protein